MYSKIAKFRPANFCNLICAIMRQWTMVLTTSPATSRYNPPSMSAKESGRTGKYLNTLKIFITHLTTDPCPQSLGAGPSVWGNILLKYQATPAQRSQSQSIGRYL